MQNEILLSTGAFTGRVNGRDPHLLTRFHGSLCCDGFEFMLMDSFEPCMHRLICEYRSEGIRIPVVHARKELGDLLSSPGESAFAAARSLFAQNCEVAAALGAARLVLHGWGIPHSDDCPERLYARIPRLREDAAALGLGLSVENCVCRNRSPLAHITELARRDGDLRFTVDTRCSEFHGELADTLRSPLWASAVDHVHVNDYVGGIKDWDARYPIYQPGEGQIDWTLFFSALAAWGWRGSVTLEASAMLPDAVDCERLNKSLAFIRRHIGQKA